MIGTPPAHWQGTAQTAFWPKGAAGTGPYPPQALELSQQGVVMIRAVINGDGDPETVEVARGSGFSLLDQAALRAVKHWRLMPAMVEGNTVTASVQVPVVFHIQ